MSDTEPTPRAPINFEEFIERKRITDSIPIEVGGKTFYLRSPVTFSEEERRRFDEASTEDETAAVICDDLPGFLEAGGTIAGLLGIVEDIAAEKLKEQGLDLGEVLRSLGS